MNTRQLDMSLIVCVYCMSGEGARGDIDVGNSLLIHRLCARARRGAPRCGTAVLYSSRTRAEPILRVHSFTNHAQAARLSSAPGVDETARFHFSIVLHNTGANQRLRVQSESIPVASEGRAWHPWSSLERDLVERGLEPHL